MLAAAVETVIPDGWRWWKTMKIGRVEQRLANHSMASCHVQ
jgi:hypothetical protein